MELNLESCKHFLSLLSCFTLLSSSQANGMGLCAHGRGAMDLAVHSQASALTQFHQTQLCRHEHGLCCIFNCKSEFT